MSRTAMVTGAAGGLGRAFAWELAARGYELVLTDRVPFEPVVPAETVVIDLADQGQRAELAKRVAGVDLLVNNAGFGLYAMFVEGAVERWSDMIRVQVMAPMELAHAALPAMLARGSGGIINVSSVAARTRFPRDAVYTGTKTYLIAWTEVLAIELTGTGVRVQALCPGWMRTGIDRHGEKPSPIPPFLYSSPESVVRASLDNLGLKVTVYPSWRAKVAATAVGSGPGRAVMARVRKRRA